MASTFTPNINAEEPGRGDQVGVWDTPVNNNSTLLDLVCGGIATIGLNNSNVVLSAVQFQAAQITFNSTLTGSVTITFPSSFKKPYAIQHLCTGSSTFTITLQTTVAGGQVICPPPGEIIDCWNDGTNVKFRNLGRVGTYMDYTGSSTPNWNDGCTIRPYRNCDGSALSSTEHPALFGLIGGTLPDARGRSRFALNQGTGRITAGGGGVDGNALGAFGGNEFLQAHTHANSLNDPGHNHAANTGNGPAGAITGEFVSATGNNGLDGTAIQSHTTGMTITNASAGAGGSQNMPPAYVGGLTLIRAG